MEIELINVKISEGSSSKDRRALFARLCELLVLDQQEEADKLEIKTTKAGLEVAIGHIFAFCFHKKLDVTFGFTEGSIEVSCPEKQATGKDAIEKPEAIKSTSVDEAPKDPKDGFASVAEEDPVEEEDEDDDGPF